MEIANYTEIFAFSQEITVTVGTIGAVTRVQSQQTFKEKFLVVQTLLVLIPTLILKLLGGRIFTEIISKTYEPLAIWPTEYIKWNADYWGTSMVFRPCAAAPAAPPCETMYPEYDPSVGYGVSSASGGNGAGVGNLVAPYSCKMQAMDNWIEDWGFCSKNFGLSAGQSGCTVQPHHAFVGNSGNQPLTSSDCEKLYNALGQLSTAKINGYDIEVNIDLDNGDPTTLKTTINTDNTNGLAQDANFGTVTGWDFIQNANMNWAPAMFVQTYYGPPADMSGVGTCVIYVEANKPISNAIAFTIWGPQDAKRFWKDSSDEWSEINAVSTAFGIIRPLDFKGGDITRLNDGTSETPGTPTGLTWAGAGGGSTGGGGGDGGGGGNTGDGGGDGSTGGGGDGSTGGGGGGSATPTLQYDGLCPSATYKYQTSDMTAQQCEDTCNAEATCKAMSFASISVPAQSSFPDVGQGVCYRSESSPPPYLVTEGYSSSSDSQVDETKCRTWCEDLSECIGYTYAQYGYGYFNDYSGWRYGVCALYVDDNWSDQHTTFDSIAFTLKYAGNTADIDSANSGSYNPFYTGSYTPRYCYKKELVAGTTVNDVCVHLSDTEYTFTVTFTAFNVPSSGTCDYDDYTSQYPNFVTRLYKHDSTANECQDKCEQESTCNAFSFLPSSSYFEYYWWSWSYYSNTCLLFVQDGTTPYSDFSELTSPNDLTSENPGTGNDCNVKSLGYSAGAFSGSVFSGSATMCKGKEQLMTIQTAQCSTIKGDNDVPLKISARQGQPALTDASCLEAIPVSIVADTYL